MRNPFSTRAKAIGATTAITVGLLAGGAGIAAAGSSLASHDGPGHHEGPHGAPLGHGGGVVSAVSPTSLTVTALDGTSTTYGLTSATTYDKGPKTTATAADVTVGARVFVVATSSSATTAASVHIEQPHVAGTVQAIDGTTLTVADDQGFWHSVVVAGSTTYAKSGATAGLSDVTVGSFVVTAGTIAADHTTLDAASVSIGLPSAAGHAGPAKAAHDAEGSDD